MIGLVGLGSIQGYEDRKTHPPIQRIVALKNLVLRFSNIKTGPSIVIRLTVGVLCPPRPIPGNVVDRGEGTAFMDGLLVLSEPATSDTYLSPLTRPPAPTSGRGSRTPQGCSRILRCILL